MNLNILKADLEILGRRNFAETRVPLQFFFDYLEKGKSPDDFLNDFPNVKHEEAITAKETYELTNLKGRVFAGTNIPLETLFDYLEGGNSLEDFLENFPNVIREQAVAVIEAAEKCLEVDRIFEIAQQEINELISGKSTLNAEDCLKLRNFAEAKTNISKPDETLTAGELVWKTYYTHYDNEYSIRLNDQEKSSKVREEIEQAFVEIIGEKQKLDASDYLKLSNNAESKTNIIKADETLTEEEKIWKAVYLHYKREYELTLKHEEKLRILEFAKREIEEWSAGDFLFDIRKAVAFRKHAKSRTNLSKKDENLTVEEKVWKTVYNGVDEQIAISLGQEEKAKFDELEKRTEETTEALAYIKEKLRRDGDDSKKGVFILILFPVFGVIISWILYSSLSAILIGSLFSFITGLLFVVFILRNSFIGVLFGRYLRNVSIFLGKQKLKQIADRIMEKAWEIKN